MQSYHPARVLSLVYQPTALITLAIFAYKEAKINTRLRNLFGYILFFLSSLAVLVVCFITSSCMSIHTYLSFGTSKCFLVEFISCFRLVNSANFMSIVGSCYQRQRRSWSLCRDMHYKCDLWSSRCTCAGWDGRRFIFHATSTHSSRICSLSVLHTTMIA